MESLKDVLVRVQGMTEERAHQKLDEAKALMEEGKTPEEVLLSLYGVDINELEDILNPSLQEV